MWESIGEAGYCREDLLSCREVGRVLNQCLRQQPQVTFLCFYLSAQFLILRVSSISNAFSSLDYIFLSVGRELN